MQSLNYKEYFKNSKIGFTNIFFITISILKLFFQLQYLKILFKFKYFYNKLLIIIIKFFFY